MKNLILILMIISSSFILSACSGGSDGGATTGTKVEPAPTPEPEPEPEAHQYFIRFTSAVGNPFRSMITRNAGTVEEQTYSWHYNVAGGYIENGVVGYNFIILVWNDGGSDIAYSILEDNVETQNGVIPANGFANINQGYTGP